MTRVVHIRRLESIPRLLKFAFFGQMEYSTRSHSHKFNVEAIAGGELRGGVEN
jgi:hypothetical protein